MWLDNIILKKMTLRNIFFTAALFSSLHSFAGEVTLKIEHQYLNFPVSQRVDRRPMTMRVSNGEECTSVIRLAESAEEYWVFQDVSLWKGLTVTISGDFSDAALARIYQADEIAQGEQIGHEPLRPQYHFTARRGWINDPNGSIFILGSNGESGTYHLFFQHNPYEREWENMHWGHAVSTDLFHWTELPLALHPDRTGTMFSGTSVWIPEERVPEWLKAERKIYINKVEKGMSGKKGKKGKMASDLSLRGNTAGEGVFAVFYTADTPSRETQCMAYSFDGGLTFQKYAGNPVVDSHDRWDTRDTRDPKVFWYADGAEAAGGHWVMVVNERTGNTIYNSSDLVSWTPVSHIEGFWECPELFRLPVLGSTPADNDYHWVMWGASGTYMIGQFDGRTFTPETTKLCNLNGSAYAAQTIANMPEDEGRVVKMTWGRISFDDSPFNGCMLLPQEQTLRRTSNGLRLFSYPVRETNHLFERAFEGSNLTAQDANKMLERFRSDDVLRIKVTLQLTYATDAGISYRGQRLLSYDLNGNRLNGEFYAADRPGAMDITADIFVDRSVVEVFIDGGAFSYSMRRDGREDKGYEIWGNQVRVKNIEVQSLR